MAAHDEYGKGGATNVLPLSPIAKSSEEEPGGAPMVGWLVSHHADEGPTVDWPGNAGCPVRARSTVALEDAVAQASVASRRGVVLLFEGGDAQLPIIVGLLTEGPTVDAQLPTATPDAIVDGKRVKIDGADEIVLRCGAASIVLRRNGRVIIRGTYVETRSSGTHRIKGGSVLIN
jgi:hypothetical protein